MKHRQNSVHTYRKEENERAREREIYRKSLKGNELLERTSFCEKWSQETIVFITHNNKKGQRKRRNNPNCEVLSCKENYQKDIPVKTRKQWTSR